MPRRGKRTVVVPPVDVKAVVRYLSGYRCAKCGKSNEEHFRKTGCQLDVHRLVPGSAYTVEGCVTLCTSCHSGKPKSTPVKRNSIIKGEIDLRAEPAWVARVERQAKRLGVSLSAYIRQATTRQLERDEASEPATPPEDE